MSKEKPTDYKKGDTLEISQWRADDSKFEAVASSDPYLYDDTQGEEVWAIGYEYTGPEDGPGYALWDEVNHMWEDGEF